MLSADYFAHVHRCKNKQKVQQVYFVLFFLLLCLESVDADAASRGWWGSALFYKQKFYEMGLSPY